MHKSNGMIFKSVLIGLTLLSSQLFSAVISITPASSEVYIGNSVDLDIMVSGLGVYEDLAAFDLDFNYDPSILQFMNYSLSDNLGSVLNDEALDLSSLNYPGLLNISSISLLGNLETQPDAFKIATVTLKGIAKGVGNLSLSNVLPGDSFGEIISAETRDASVSSVSEPPSMIFFASGITILAGFAMFRRKRI